LLTGTKSGGRISITEIFDESPFNASAHEKAYGGWIFRILANQYPTSDIASMSEGQ
jgi:hypothetical protein